MGLTPDERVPDVLEYIKSRGFNCNTFLAMFLFEALYDHGAADYAFQLLTADGEDSPMHMVRQGATTTWEAWALEQKWNTSLFHPRRRLRDISLQAGSWASPLEPGFKRMRIRPQLGPLEQADIRVPTLYGPVRVKVSRTLRPEETVSRGAVFEEDVPDDAVSGGVASESFVSLEVDVPSNTRAEVWVPRMGVARAKTIVDGKECEGRPSGDWLVLEDVPPGARRRYLSLDPRPDLERLDPARRHARPDRRRPGQRHRDRLHPDSPDVSKVTESGDPADKAAGVRPGGAENGTAVYTIGSGTYRFSAPQHPAR